MASTIYGINREINDLERQYNQLSARYENNLQALKDEKDRELRRLERESMRRLREIEKFSTDTINKNRDEMNKIITVQFAQKDKELKELKKQLEETERELLNRQKNLEREIEKLKHSRELERRNAESYAIKALKDYENLCKKVLESNMPVLIVCKEDFEGNSNPTLARARIEEGNYGAAIGICDINSGNINICYNKTVNKMKQYTELFENLEAEFDALTGFFEMDSFSKFPLSLVSKEDNDNYKNIVIDRSFLSYWSNGWYQRDFVEKWKEIRQFISDVRRAKEVGKYIKDNDFSDFEKKVQSYIIDIKLMNDELIRIRRFSIMNCIASDEKLKLTEYLERELPALSMSQNSRRIMKKDSEELTKCKYLTLRQKKLSGFNTRENMRYEACDTGNRHKIIVFINPKYDIEACTVQNSTGVYIQPLQKEGLDSPGIRAIMYDFQNHFEHIFRSLRCTGLNNITPVQADKDGRIYEISNADEASELFEKSMEAYNIKKRQNQDAWYIRLFGDSRKIG